MKPERQKHLYRLLIEIASLQGALLAFLVMFPDRPNYNYRWIEIPTTGTVPAEIPTTGTVPAFREVYSIAITSSDITYWGAPRRDNTTRSVLVALVVVVVGIGGLFTKYMYAVRRRDGSLDAHHSLHSNNGTTQRPPRLAEYLLYFLPRQTRDPLIGDLQEEFGELSARFSERHAKVWYWTQVITSFWSYLCRAFRTFFRWGVVAWVGDMVRRLIP